MSGFTSSSEEEEDEYNVQEEEEQQQERHQQIQQQHQQQPRPHPPPPPLRLDFVDMTAYGLPPHCLALSALPGCKFRDVRRNLDSDIADLRDAHGVTDVICLLQPTEFLKFRVPSLLERMEDQGIAAHHFPVDDGRVPDIGQLEDALRLLRRMLRQGRVVLIHCFGGLGRTGVLAACLLLSVDEVMTPDEAISRIRALRGPRAIQSVKQYNLVHEYRQLQWEYHQDKRPLSR